MDGGKTGWPAGLLQDDCRGLAKWFASRMDARYVVRQQQKDKDCMTTEDLIARLRGCVQKLRTTSMPIADIAPAIHEAADALEALGRELAELKNDVFSYKVAWETVCDGAKDVVSDLEKTRAELAAIRAQEPVATIEISVRGSTTMIDNHFSDVVRNWPEGEYQLYASPVAKDAGLVADGWQPIETAPKDGTLILVREPRCSGLAVMYSNGWKYESGHISYLEPTHWMPLPASPKIGGV